MPYLINLREDFVEIIEILEKRLNDKGKYWRHVFKVWRICPSNVFGAFNPYFTQCLALIDYLLHSGSENVVTYFKENVYVIKTLREFQYIDDDGKDQGANVRQKAKDITNLLQDEGRLRDQRKNRTKMRDRMMGRTSDDTDNSESRRHSRTKSLDDRAEKRRVLEERKEAAQKKRATAEEQDLKKALKLSEEEEAKRAQAVADSNTASLFNDAPYVCLPKSCHKSLTVLCQVPVMT